MNRRLRARVSLRGGQQQLDRGTTPDSGGSLETNRASGGTPVSDLGPGHMRGAPETCGLRRAVDSTLQHALAVSGTEAPGAGPCGPPRRQQGGTPPHLSLPRGAQAPPHHTPAMTIPRLPTRPPPGPEPPGGRLRSSSFQKATPRPLPRKDSPPTPRAGETAHGGHKGTATASSQGPRLLTDLVALSMSLHPTASGSSSVKRGTNGTLPGPKTK